MDIGARSSIYQLIAQAGREGTAVLVSSSETKELVSICDRVLVLRDGRVASVVERGALTEARLVRESPGQLGEQEDLVDDRI